MIGETLNHYRILRPLGRGGMGEVYVAMDTKLGREIALKVLPPGLAEHDEARQRFAREAKAVAALNHPNIVTLHSIEEADGTHFMTMELLDGRPLSAIIPPDGLPLAQIFALAIPLAEAISAAHERGITHRDLKPQNIVVTGDGRVKVLDFGLAKLRQEAPGKPLGTVASMETGEGRILGTVAYMSPEQAQGQAIDHRSDIFSLGVLLYEMATGRPPFRGDTGVSIISSILKDTPVPLTEVRHGLPRHLGRIIKQCLAKEPTRRLQTALDLRNQLEELREELDSGELALPAPRAPRPSRRPLVFGILAIGAVAVAVFLALDRGESQGDGRPLTSTLTRLTTLPGQELSPSLSPDGKTVVYASKAAGNWDIYVLRIGGANPVNLTADCKEGDSEPAFSPDGEFVAFRSERAGGGIFVMGATGESVRRLTDYGHNPAWSPDGERVVFSTEQFASPLGRGTVSELWTVRAAGGETTRLSTGDAIQPHWSPHGHRIAYWALRHGSGQRDIWTIPAGGGEPVAVTHDDAVDWNPRWSPDGAFLYFSSDRGGSMNVWRVAIEERSGKVLGEPEPVTTGGSASRGFLSVSSDGRRVAYVEQTLEQHIYKVGLDPASGHVRGEPTPVVVDSIPMDDPAASPDGTQLAFWARSEQEDISVCRADGTGRRWLTQDAAKDRAPVWLPDGERIAFQSDRSGSWEIWTIRQDGSGLRQLTHAPGRSYCDPVWSPDPGRFVCSDGWASVALIIDVGRSGGPPRESQLPPIDEAGSYFYPYSWSPDGKWLAGCPFLRDGSGEGISVFSLDRGEYEILLEFGTDPKWLDDDRLLFNHQGKLWLLHRGSRECEFVLALPQPAEVDGTCVSGDTVYFTRTVREGDIWMLTLE